MKNTKVRMRKRLSLAWLLLSMAFSACGQPQNSSILPLNAAAPVTFVTATHETVVEQASPTSTMTARVVPSGHLPTATISSTETPIPTATATLVPTATAMPRVAVPTPPSLSMSEPALPVTRLVIPALSLDTSVEVSFIKNDLWDIDSLTDEVGHLQGTGSPGSQNNVVLAGHITLAPDGRPGPFYNLGYLTKGETVILYHDDQSYIYEIDGMTTVKPTDVQVAYPTSVDRLTLITCLNYDDTQQEYTDRLVLWGHLSEKTSP